MVVVEVVVMISAEVILAGLDVFKAATTSAGSSAVPLTAVEFSPVAKAVALEGASMNGVYFFHIKITQLYKHLHTCHIRRVCCL